MNTYKPGDWLAICDSCGFRFMASELKDRWDGFKVCAADWETQHPLDFIKPRTDRVTVPWARPDVNASDAHDITYVDTDDSHDTLPTGHFNNGT